MIKIKFRDRGIRALTVLTITLVILFPASTLAQPEVSILYHEPLELLELAAADDGSTARIVFDAFGRRFVLLVDESVPGTSGPGIELIKARVADAPESWARLTLRGDIVSGLIDDPHDTYVIESRSTVVGTLIVSDHDADSPSIIYRLSDALVAPGLLSCDTHHEGEHVDGKTAFAGLAAELDASASLAATDGYRATVGVVADSYFFARLGGDSQAMIDEMFLTVDGIYAEQVGIEIETASIFVSTTPAADPLSDQRDGSALLDELGQWRLQNQTHLAMTHLLTNRRLLNVNGNPIAGISFLGTPGRSGVCDARTGASISEWMGSGLTALIIAHEIGHNFGAPHDGELPEPGGTPNACANVLPDLYLMSPMLQGTRNNEFSQCSIEQINKVIAAATCLRPVAESQAIAGVPNGGGSSLHWSAVLLLIGLAIACRRRRDRRMTATQLM